MLPPLTTVVCPLSGGLFDDQTLREQVLQELLISENIAPRRRHPWYRGGTDREFLSMIWQSYRRSLSEAYLTQLVQQYHRRYEQSLKSLPELPWDRATQTFLQQAGAYGYQIGLCTEHNWSAFLAAPLPIQFGVADYAALPDPQTTLVIETTQRGIQRARAVGSWVIGVAQQMPYHWMQRHAHWAVDTLAEWDWQWLGWKADSSTGDS
ncbi:MAG: hypothetical protein Q6J33_01260 [Gloeomargarita sp. DG_2_bins_126]